jgi:hypothetical protein
MEAQFRELPAAPARDPADFAAVLLAAAVRWQADRADRYAAGALACGQWIAGLRTTHPLTNAPAECTPAALVACQIAADSIVYGLAGAPNGVDHRWAMGVAAMASWTRGAARRPPVDPSGGAIAA